MRISFFFALYDFWIGVFYDRKKQTWYICLLPCCVLKIEQKPFELKIDADTIRFLKDAQDSIVMQCAMYGHDFTDVPGLGVVCVACGAAAVD